MTLRLLALASSVVVLSCLDGVGHGHIQTPRDDPEPFVIDERAGCENLNPAHCLLPWPSSRYLVDDPGTATGRRVALPESAMPINRYGDPFETTAYNRLDGFSPMSTILTVVEGAFDASVLPAEDRIGESLSDSSPTVLIDANTGERIAHFAEVDSSEGTDPDRAAMFIRPARRLAESHRYIVAIRGLVHLDGSPVTPSNYFRALRDGLATTSAELEGRRDRFEDIFARLEGAGIARASLLEAWDFETGSGTSLWTDVVQMRDDALARVSTTPGFGCTVTNVTDTPTDPTVFRAVSGTFTVPLYLSSTADDARLVRDASGRPMFNGTTEAPFRLVIPPAVASRVTGGGAPGPLLTFGHGLFESADESMPFFATEEGIPERLGMVAVGTDWWGLSSADLVHVANAVSDLGRFPEIVDRLMQGVINVLVLTHAFAGACSDLPELRVAQGRGTAPVIDGSERYYVGYSLGSILGTTLAALSTEIERFALVVGGVSFPIMIPRSVRYPTFAEILDAFYDQKLDRVVLLVMTGMLWDLIEPATYAPHVLHDPLPGALPKRVLYQIAMNDAQVPNVASEIAARTIGLPSLAPPVREAWGLTAETAPVDSAFVMYDLGASALPLGPTVPAYDNEVHVRVRLLDSAQSQLGAFLQPDGRVENFCSGACDPD